MTRVISSAPMNQINRIGLRTLICMAVIAIVLMARWALK